MLVDVFSRIVKIYMSIGLSMNGGMMLLKLLISIMKWLIMLLWCMVVMVLSSMLSMIEIGIDMLFMLRFIGSVFFMRLFID